MRHHSTHPFHRNTDILDGLRIPTRPAITEDQDSDYSSKVEGSLGTRSEHEPRSHVDRKTLWKLWAKVLLQALFDYEDTRQRLTRKGYRTEGRSVLQARQDEVGFWIADRRHHENSFETICGLLELDSQSVRDQLRKIENATDVEQRDFLQHIKERLSI